MQNVSHAAILAQQCVLAPVSMGALDVRVVVVVAVVLHVMVANHIMDVEAASPGAQAAQVHAKDVVVVVVVDVREIAAEVVELIVEVVVVVTVVTHVQMGVPQGVVILLE